MNWYKVVLTLAGPTGTPWQADTIFGHLCWGLLYLKGEAALKNFLDLYREGRPPLLLSSGFPGDLLPRPLTLQGDKPPKEAAASEAEVFQRRRDLRKQGYILYDDFLRALKGEEFFPRPVGEELKKLQASRVTPKNQIDRVTGTTGEGGQFFGFREFWMPKVIIYLKVEKDWEDIVSELFEFLAKTGYGKRKSVGYGAILKEDFQSFLGFPVPPNANAFVTLSPFVPAETDPAGGLWRTRVKYGKLSEGFASLPNPFKRPLLMLTEGSVFYDIAPREWYGRMVTGVSLAHPEVVHYGYALAVPMSLPARPGSVSLGQEGG